jgi:predicted porin
MQKKLIALAIAGLASTAAFAQTNVTIYGVADAAVLGTTYMGNPAKQTQFNVNSGVLSTSRIGFKGVEDLGNGLKALFVLEYGLTIDDNTGVGAGSAMGRQQFVGLTGGFGTAVAGRLQTTGLDFAVAATALGGSTGLGAYHNAGGGTLITSATRANNAVAYISPSFGGVTVAYNHARMTECAGTTGTGICDGALATTGKTGETDNTANLLSVSYANGPITAGAIYTKLAVSSTAANDSVKEWGLRAGYDFSVVKLQAVYQQQKNEATAAVGKDKKWAVSLSAPIGAKVAVIAEYAALNIGSVAGEDNVKVGTLATTYALSKRTTAYAGVVAKRSQVLNSDQNTYGLGLRHMF